MIIEYENITSFTGLMTSANTVRRLSPRASCGITERLLAICDVIRLSIILIYLALLAGNLQAGDTAIALLSMKMSINHFVVLAFCCVVWQIILSYCGLYAWQHVRTVSSIVGRLILAMAFSALIEREVIAALWHHGNFMTAAIYCWITGVCSAIVLRIIAAAFYIYVLPQFKMKREAIVMGYSPRSKLVCHELMSHPEWNYEFLGFVGSHLKNELIIGERMLGSVKDHEGILIKYVVDEVIIALFAKTEYKAIENTIDICKRVGVQVQYCEDLFEASHPGQCLCEKYDHRRVVTKMVQDDYSRQIKRAFDIVEAVIGLIVFAPLLLIVAVLIKYTSKGPIFVTQERHGLNKRTIRIYKCCTMVDNSEAGHNALEHMNQNSGPVFKIFKNLRVTKSGLFLRRTSIGELPQLLNILKKDMSFIGPRPLNKRDKDRFSGYRFLRRSSVNPRITCLWQISRRSNLNSDRWIELDLNYIDRWSLKMDLQILTKTFSAVVKGTGAA